MGVKVNVGTVVFVWVGVGEFAGVDEAGAEVLVLVAEEGTVVFVGVEVGGTVTEATLGT